MIKNIIFDFDGVLVDSEILAAKAFSRYMIRFGVDISEKEFANFAGNKTVNVVEILSKKYSINDKKKFYNDIMNIAYNIYKNELTIINGAYNFINNKKLNIFIGSNSTKNRIIDGLQKVKLDKFFKPEQVYSFDLVKNPKPYPDIYLKVVKDNNLNKDETIIIEDSVIGIKAAVNAGVKVIGFTAGGHWHENRDEKELLAAGAIFVTNDYNKIDKIIEQY
tara:strand:- start:882 stop:1541 length:660 start_codon:yes stop_codon:yes gene_type:complete